jgi:hypothetical protein
LSFGHLSYQVLGRGASTIGNESLGDSFAFSTGHQPALDPEESQTEHERNADTCNYFPIQQLHYL